MQSCLSFKNFILQLVDLKPQRSFVVYSGNENYPISEGVAEILLPYSSSDEEEYSDYSEGDAESVAEGFEEHYVRNGGCTIDMLESLGQVVDENGDWVEAEGMVAT